LKQFEKKCEPPEIVSDFELKNVLKVHKFTASNLLLF